jgi:hypothetical protein
MADQTMMKVFSKLVSRIIGASTSIKKTAPCKLSLCRLQDCYHANSLATASWIASVGRVSLDC